MRGEGVVSATEYYPTLRVTVKGNMSHSVYKCVVWQSMQRRVCVLKTEV